AGGGPAAPVVPGRGVARARPGGEARAAGVAQHDRAAAPTRHPRPTARGRRRAPCGGTPARQRQRARRATPADRARHVITAGLVEALTGIVGARHVRTAPAGRRTRAGGGRPTDRRVPAVVVLAGSRDELAAVVRLLAAHDVPFVPRGAGTGLSGGALADGAAVLLVLTRLNRILSLDPSNRVAVVEPGVVNARLSAAAAPHGLHYAPDPSSQTACTIGGNVAENAGGPHCLKYGVTAQHVLALEVVLADGRVVELGSPSGEPWGPDMVGLFVGSEGNFGIATRIAVRLLPQPRAVRTLLAAFASLRAAGEAVSAVIASGIVPAALEMMDQSCIRAVEDSVYAAGYPRDAAAVLLVELDARVPGLRSRVDAASTEIMEACVAAGGTITGEHGVGLDKLRYMPLIFDAESLAAMRAVRRVWDPEERVNPGKVVPVHACR